MSGYAGFVCKSRELAYSLRGLSPDPSRHDYILFDRFSIRLRKLRVYAAFIEPSTAILEAMRLCEVLSSVDLRTRGQRC